MTCELHTAQVHTAPMKAHVHRKFPIKQNEQSEWWQEQQIRASSIKDNIQLQEIAVSCAVSALSALMYTRLCFFFQLQGQTLNLFTVQNELVGSLTHSYAIHLLECAMKNMPDAAAVAASCQCCYAACIKYGMKL